MCLGTFVPTALEQLKVATQLEPRDPWVWEWLALAYLKLKDRRLGVEAIDRVIGLAPGSFRLQLTMGSIDAALAALANAGARVISTGGAPVRMSFGGRPWQLSVVSDANNLFLIVQQAPPPVQSASASFMTSSDLPSMMASEVSASPAHMR